MMRGGAIGRLVPLTSFSKASIAPPCSAIIPRNFSSTLLRRAEEGDRKLGPAINSPDFDPVLEDYDPDPRTVEEGAPRIPLPIQAVYYKPLRRQQTHGLPVCNLQIRSYAVRNLEMQVDIALRAAYYLGLPASGPVPLPRRIERWTVPRSNFAHKKSQENFERITMSRLIQIKDGHPDTVQIWLAFLRKHAFYGVGMKANVWEWEDLDVGKRMDKEMSEFEKEPYPKYKAYGKTGSVDTASMVKEILESEQYRDLGAKEETK